MGNKHDTPAAGDDTEKVDPPTEPAGPETLTFDWRGVTLTAPADPDDWSFDTARALEDGRGLRFVELVLGNQMRLVRRAVPGLKSSDGADLMNTYMAAVNAAVKARAGE